MYDRSEHIDFLVTEYMENFMAYGEMLLCGYDREGLKAFMFALNDHLALLNEFFSQK